MDEDLFSRPAWIAHLGAITFCAIVASLVGSALLMGGYLADSMVWLGAVATASPLLVLLALVPVLRHEMRLVDSFRAGLLDRR